MFTRKDMAQVISDRFVDKKGGRIPKYFAEAMVDYVVEAMKVGLIEDGVVVVWHKFIIERIDVPEHEKRMPNGDIITVPTRVRLKFKPQPDFLQEILEEDEA